MDYHHTQRGTLMLTVLPLAALVAGLLGILAAHRSEQWPWAAFAICALLGGSAWLFSSLIVDVSGSEVRWYFEPRLWEYRIALSDIGDVRIVQQHLAEWIWN